MPYMCHCSYPGKVCSLHDGWLYCREYVIMYCYEPRVAVVLKHCQGCMRVHVCVGFVMGRL